MVSLFRPVRPSFLPPGSLLLFARARASMYVFIDVTRDSRTQLTARKHRMHRGYTSVFRVRLWHPLSGAECRSRFLYDINPRSAMHLIHEDRVLRNNVTADPENEFCWKR